MEVWVFDSYEELSRAAARVVAEQIRRKPDSVLGFATGSTPLGMYAELERMHREEGLDFSRVVTFNLDEYCGLPADHPQSYHTYMWEHLFRHVNVRPENVHLPDGMAADVAAECARYEALVRAAGYPDLQLLGIGTNGHIGFNEPGTPFEAETHCVALQEKTRRANARFFGSIEAVPRHAISMGIKTIMRARRILLLASGASKAEAIARSLRGPVTTEVPGSVLQLHPAARIFVDREAARLLEESEARDGRHIASGQAALL